MNPCPCGHYGDQTRACTCPEGAVSRYRKRLSGPLLDRIDLHAEVPRVDYEKLSSDGLSESSAAVRARVEAARARQWARFATTGANGAAPGLTSNAEMGVREVRRWCVLDRAGEALLRARPSPSSDCRRGPTTACSKLLAPSPTWRTRRTSARPTSPRPGGQTVTGTSPRAARQCLARVHRAHLRPSRRTL